MPSAMVRRRSNQPATALIIGTYVQAVPTPVPTPYVTPAIQSVGAMEVRTRPTLMTAAPASSSARGPWRSEAGPVTNPSRKCRAIANENTVAVAPRPAPNSADRPSNITPKLYVIPNATAFDRNATATTSHALVLSTALLHPR